MLVMQIGEEVTDEVVDDVRLVALACRVEVESERLEAQPKPLRSSSADVRPRGLAVRHHWTIYQFTRLYDFCLTQLFLKNINNSIIIFQNSTIITQSFSQDVAIFKFSSYYVLFYIYFCRRMSN